MDRDRFDVFTRSLGAAASRRGLGRALTGGGLGTLVGALGLTLWQGAGPPQLVAAKNCKKIKDKKKRKKCLRNAKETTPPNTLDPVSPPPTDPDSPPPPAPTCNDGIKNGTESGVDCGGTCPRCANGSTCIGRNDCIGALCLNNVCTSCSAIGSECFSDTHGACACQNGLIGPVCTSSEPLYSGPVIPCTDCPPGTTACIIEFSGPSTACFGPCGGV